MRNNCVTFFTLLALSLCASHLSAATPPKKPYNILFIASDDLNTDIGCYGSKQVKTPYLDKLASMGARFDRAYCQQPLCGPSRASIMTGLRPNTTGFHYLNDDLRQLMPDAMTMGQFFQKKGYYVARVGKIYHYGNPGQIGTDGNDDAPTWMERFNPAGIDKKQEHKITAYGEGRQGKNLGISMAWWDPVSEDSDHTDGMVADKAIELIEKHKDRPFFIAAGFFNPHCPYVAPKKYFDMYPMDEITMQDLASARKDLEDVPPMAVQRDTKNWPYYFKGVTLEEARKCKQAYYATVSFVDAQVGRLMDALKKNGLMDNTIIIFWSDHGYFLGEKGLWYKRKNFERSVRVPLIFAGPGIKPGVSCMRPVELTDVFPTLAQYSGHEIPDGLDGLSLRPLIEDPTGKNWTRPAISQVHHAVKAQGYSIRDDRWRYTEWNRGEAGIELYDHENDPDEITNLAKQPEHKAVIARLSAELRKYSDTYKARKSAKKKPGKKKKK